MQRNIGLSAARKANNLKMGRRVGLLILLAAFALLCISAMAQENDANHWIKEGYKQKWKGSVEESNKSFERALDIYDMEIKTNPKDLKAWENKSSVLLIMGRVEESISVMDSAVDANPNDPGAWNSKGFALITIAASDPDSNVSIGIYNESLLAFDKALELDPQNAEAWRGKGVVFSDLKDYSEALRCFNMATDLNPLYEQAWRSKGILLLEIGRPEESIQALDQALKIEPNDVDALTMKAQALSALGRYEESSSVFDRAMKIDPAEPQPQAAPAQNKGNSSAPLALDGNSDIAASIFDSSSNDGLDDGELWI